MQAKPTSVPSPPASGADATLQPAWFWAAAGLLIVSGAVLRLLALDRIPPGLWYDEAIYALDAVEAMRAPRIFYDTGNHMREPLYIWGLGLWFHLFGVGVWEARAFSAFLGTAILAAFVPFCREFLRGMGLGMREACIWTLAALAVLVCLRWHVHFSRTIFRAISPVLVFVLLSHAWLLFHATVGKRWALWSGVLLGTGLYTYLSWRLMPLLVVAWAAHGLISGKYRNRAGMAGLGIIAGSSLVVAAPLLIHFIEKPDHFRGRTQEVSLFSQTETVVGSDGQSREVTTRRPLMESLGAVGGNAVGVALMWNVRGDHVGKHNVPYLPVFDPVSGVFFLAGVGVALWRARRDFHAFMLVSSVAVLSLASVLSFGAPNILRTQTLIPATVLLFVMGLMEFHRLLVARWPEGRTLVETLITVLVLGGCAWQVTSYFVLMPRSAAVRQEFQTDTFYLPAVEIRRLAMAASPPETIWVPQEMASHPTFEFTTLGAKGLRPYPNGGWPLGALRPGHAVLLTARACQLALPRDLRNELRDAGVNRRVATIPIQRTDGPPVPHAELTEIVAAGN